MLSVEYMEIAFGLVVYRLCGKLRPKRIGEYCLQVLGNSINTHALSEIHYTNM